nr:SDR family oxidoreductase [Flavobacterium fluvii]
MPSDVEKAIQFTLNEYGKIDVIHNNAGIANPSKPLEITDEYEWDKFFDVNLKSILFTTRYGLDALKQTQGCILNTSSLVGEIGQENHAAYSATKGALNALTKSMALDYAKYK